MSLSAGSTSSLGIPSTVPTVPRCTLCGKALPEQHKWKRCEPCKQKIQASTQRRKEREAEKKKDVLQSSNHNTLKRKEREDISAISAKSGQFDLSAISKKPRLSSSSKPDYQPLCEIRGLAEFYKALKGSKKINLNVYHSIVVDEKFDNFDRAKDVAADLQHSCGIKLGKGRVTRDKETGACLLVFQPEPFPGRLNGPVKIGVEKDESHPLGIDGQKVTIQIYY